MLLNHYSLETASELLMYLAEHEEFSSVRKLRELGQDEVRGILRDVAENLKQEAGKQPLVSRKQLRPRDLPNRLSKVIENLTPQEENTLFKTFRIS